MNETDIRKYAELMKELELTGLEIKEDNKVVRLERNVTAAGGAVYAVAPASSPTAAAGNNPAEAVSGGAAKENPGNCVSVKSPIVGVFYAASAENADPYVSLGDRVEKGKTLCIIEAMKLMNEICAEESGEIIEICVTNGQMVEYGTELFRIRTNS